MITTATDKKSESDAEFFAGIIAAIDCADAPAETETEVFVVNRSVEYGQFPKNSDELSENVFDSENETGTKIIQYLYDCGEKYKEANRILFVHNQPTIEAYEAELSLVNGIRQREAGNISAEALKTLVEHYMKTHSPDADVSPDKWTGKDVPLVYFKILLNGEELEAYTCNKIQSQILAAMWQRIRPEAGFSAIPL